jgi:exodeoxyribonuclease V alpha subunit
LPSHQWPKNSNSAENARTCKYGARLLTNDDAIGLLEQFLSAVRELTAMEDGSEDWANERWLLACIAELWSKRGLYPGLLNVMGFLNAECAITRAKDLSEAGKSKEAHRLFFDAVEKNADAPALDLAGKALQKLSRRQWLLKPVAARQLLGSQGLGMSRCFSATISTWCDRSST